jgi:type II secretory pathway pseudopilin PulG
LWQADEKLDSEFNMLAQVRQISKRKASAASAAFTLFEVLISVVILAMVMGGVIYGYVQANRNAEWNSMSYAAQSYALQGLEQVRAAKWDLSAMPVWDDIPAPTNYIQIDIMDVPVSGAPLRVTNYISLTTIAVPNSSAQLRQVRSDCVWVFPRTGKTFTNTVITYRAPDKA